MLTMFNIRRTWPLNNGGNYFFYFNDKYKELFKLKYVCCGDDDFNVDPEYDEECTKYCYEAYDILKGCDSNLMCDNLIRHILKTTEIDFETYLQTMIKKFHCHVVYNGHYSFDFEKEKDCIAAAEWVESLFVAAQLSK